MKIKTLILIIFTLFFINIYNIATANNQNNDIYKIELLIFTNDVKPDSLYSNFEKIIKPKNINILEDNSSNDSNSIEVVEQTRLLTKLSTEDSQLKSFSQKIKNSPNYKIINQFAWYQDLSKKTGVYFTGGENYYENNKNNTSTDILAKGNNPFDNINKIDLEKLKTLDNNSFKFLNPEWELEGLVYLQKFTRSKVHAELNLLINAPVILSNHVHYKTFTINQNRNIALDDANYFDNPYFGAIMYVTKAKDF